MNTTKNLTYTGISVVLAGIFILLTNQIGFSTSKILISIFFIVGSYFSYSFASRNKQHQALSNSQIIQGIALLFIGTFLFVPNNVTDYLNYITFFFLFVAIYEFSFVFIAFDTDTTKLSKDIAIDRIIAGGIGLISASVLLVTSWLQTEKRILLVGIIVLLFGLGIVRFSRKVRNVLKQNG